MVTRAQHEPQAAGEGSGIDDPTQRAAVSAYNTAMLDEVRALASITREAVISAAGLSTNASPPVGQGPNTLWNLMSNPRAPTR